MITGTSKALLSGVIEGFYGQSWSWDARRGYADFLAENGLDCYIYAPKDDPWLRRNWRYDWPDDHWIQLQALSEHYLLKGVKFGVGLSPFELYNAYDAAGRRDLQLKLSRIGQLRPAILAILFDDMPGDVPDLARNQAEIVNDIVKFCPDCRIIMCPTYYSFDPVLERFFGAIPENYWQDLGAELDAGVDIFWTGNQVCSTTITVADIEEISQTMGRPPILWDNYPVNDGARASRFLHLNALTSRSPNLASYIKGHLCNPMNQAELSKIPLASLARLYRGEYDPDAARALAIASFGGSKGAELLQEHWRKFQDLGLDMISSEERNRLKERFRCVDEPATREVYAWLNEEYRFDPECLTG
ncbi:MAG: hyaluronoglucosaminidase [Halieaceae bacterium]|jgi:hyaluronoglucosaminidase